MKPNKLNIPISKIVEILNELKIYVPLATLRDVKDIIELPDIGGDAGMRDFFERESAEEIVKWIVDMGMAEELWNNYENMDKGILGEVGNDTFEADMIKREIRASILSICMEFKIGIYDIEQIVHEMANNEK